MAEKDIGDRAIGRMGATERGGEGADVRREASEMGSMARGAVEDSLNSARDVAADNVHRAAEALHAAASEMGQNDTFGSLINAAADRLDGASEALRGRDLSRMMADMNDFARRQPVLFIGGALIAGMALGRLATAGTRVGASTSTSTSTSPSTSPSTSYGSGYGTPTSAGERQGTVTSTTEPLRGGGLGTESAGPANRAASTGAAQESRLSGSVGGTRGGQQTGQPSPTIPGHQAQGAKPQGRGSASGMPTDE